MILAETKRILEPLHPEATPLTSPTLCVSKQTIEWRLELLHHIARSKLVSKVLEILSGDNR